VNFYGARSNYFAELALDRPPTEPVPASEAAQLPADPPAAEEDTNDEEE
jgi:hypothetical protein